MEEVTNFHTPEGTFEGAEVPPQTPEGSTEKTNINVENFLAPVKAEEEITELKQDFMDYVKGLPKKIKRKIYPEKKFGNTLTDKMRLKRLEKGKSCNTWSLNTSENRS